MNSSEFVEKNDLFIAEHLHFALQHKWIVQNISFVLKAGSFNVLIGPNGAGKSTLLRLLAGYLTPNMGRCVLNGQEISHYSAKALAERRAVMKQHGALNFPFSAEDVVRMGGYHRRKHEVDKWFNTIIQLTDCDVLVGKTYRQLSGGEQQRVQLARALLQIWSENMHGKLLMLDEPTSAFDLYHQQHCLRLLKKLSQEQGLTVFCILHDLNLAALFGDQIFLLAEQKLQAQGTPVEVLTEENIYRWYQAKMKSLPHYAKAVPQFQFCD
ncbi:heme ABC transporter ATP-binding protein [Conservatibacter flavescens]|uniref:Heme ABC transporter ATP-binding protein n=1 Tax=Conservatibacter flavescens TaxID=28161 RepID=A0A2M8S1Q2_9PAST|nr:heme ABC transporter ATP-binding protein [Conservatibacter flavescens]PJG85057.1 heme ABC transporter ATP-binding protein [Conservatibacter flavescens]